MSTEVVMPQMGESIAEGTVTKWLKKVGDRVERDENLFEISTDKVDAEIPSPAAGTLTEIKVQEGETVAVNTVVAVLDGDGAKPDAKPEAAVPAKAEAQPAEAKPKALAPPPEVPRPARETVAPAKTAAPPAPKAAVEAPPPAKKAEPVPPAKAPSPAARPSAPKREEARILSVEELRRTKSSPLVRKIAEEHAIDITQLEGTGMSGRVTKNDILSFIESGAAPAVGAPAVATSQIPTIGAPGIVAPPTLKPAEGDRVERMSVMRKKIAEHMVLSRHTSAHVTTVYEIDMTKIAKLRDDHKESFFQRTGTKLTFMPFIFQAVTNAIRKFPIFNAQVSGDEIIYKGDVNLGMAVALDWGLIVPVIKRADDLSISGLARAANDLADRARMKQLKPDEVAGGTFTITNPGVFGGLFGTPIINQPQVAILGIGKIEKRPCVMTTLEGEDYIAIRHMAYFALSFDHRIIDGADAERFLAFVKEQLEAGQFAI